MWKVYFLNIGDKYIKDGVIFGSFYIKNNIELLLDIGYFKKRRGEIRRREEKKRGVGRESFLYVFLNKNSISFELLCESYEFYIISVNMIN